MKVLMINSVCGIRSTGRICTDLADILFEQGHACKIAYGRETVPAQYQKYAFRIGSNLDVKIHAMQTRIFDNTGFGSKRATLRLIQWIKEYNPDVIHLHNIHGYYINIEVLFNYLRTCGKRIIWTLHDCWAFTGHCTHFEFVKCNKWRNSSCSHCPQKTCYPSSYLRDNSQSNFSRKKKLFTNIANLTIVTPSVWLSNMVKQSFLGQYPVVVIHNGIDLTVFKPTYGDFREKYGLLNKKIILGVASVWDKRKGLDDFLLLASMLSDEYRIVLVGLSQKQKDALPKEIIGITRTDDTAQLAEIYTAADVFVNPTYEDNYPTTNLEAQACGTPVITYRTGGSPESVRNENIIPVKKIRRLVQRIQFVCKIQKHDSLFFEQKEMCREKCYREYIYMYRL